jgi:DNA-binding IclR family transcriptional regulator
VDESDLIEQSEPVMAEMHRLCGESIGLAVFDDDEMLMIHRKNARGRIRIVNPVGTRLPAHATALGKSILACWPSEKLDAWLAGRTLAPFTPNTITSADRLRACVDEVRREGVAFDLQESALGVLAIGSCIHNSEDEPVAALSILVPTHRADDNDYWCRLRQFAKTGACTISQAMGCYAVEGPTGLDVLNQIWEGAIEGGVVSPPD